MRILKFLTMLCCTLGVCRPPLVIAETTDPMPKTLYEISANSISGELQPLSRYDGKVILVVNTASHCGFASQFAGLEELYKKYGAQGFVILAFPSNDFKQEFAENSDVQKFCATEYGVSFPLFARGPVTGKDKQPVYRFLTEASGENFVGEVSWNFEKFVVGRDGRVKGRFGSVTVPTSNRVTSLIESLLKEPVPIK